MITLNKIYTFTQRNTKTKQKENKGTLKFNSVGENKAELYFYGDIVSDSWQSYWYEEDKCPQDIVDFLAELNSYQAIDIYINSGGGSVHGGLAIYNLLKRYPGEKTVYVDGIAPSIASVIALSADKVVIPSNAQFMIHKPWSYAYGSADELRKCADSLDVCQESIMNVYMEHVKENVSRAAIEEMVNKETWLTGKQAAEYFDIEVEECKEIVACESDYFDKYNHVPNFSHKSDKENNIELLQVELDLLGL